MAAFTLMDSSADFSKPLHTNTFPDVGKSVDMSLRSKFIYMLAKYIDCKKTCHEMVFLDNLLEE